MPQTANKFGIDVDLISSPSELRKFRYYRRLKDGGMVSLQNRISNRGKTNLPTSNMEASRNIG
jgi:hypothetical protein